MELLNEPLLARAWRKHPQAGPWLQGWVQVVREARWRSIRDVRLQFPHADGVKARSGGIVTVFNAGGNDFRLLTAILSPAQRVYVLDVLTHAEYDKGKWKEKL